MSLLIRQAKIDALNQTCRVGVVRASYPQPVRFVDPPSLINIKYSIMRHFTN